MNHHPNTPQPDLHQMMMQMMRDISDLKTTLARSTVQPAPEWVTVAEAARILTVTPGTVRRKIASGEFPAKGNGKGKLVKLPR